MRYNIYKIVEKTKYKPDRYDTTVVETHKLILEKTYCEDLTEAEQWIKDNAAKYKAQTLTILPVYFIGYDEEVL